MKFLSTVAKNLKLLFRNKESAYTIVFGPILIILIVSFALTGSSNDYAIRVGTFTPAPTAFSEKTINALNQHDYSVNVYGDETSCIDSVKTGATHACMVFSEKEAGNGTIPLTFYLDLSRTNVVYKISSDLSGVLDLQADALRAQFANDALTRMHNAGIMIDEDVNITLRVSDRMTSMNEQLMAAKTALSQLSNETMNASLQDLRGYQQGLAQNVNMVVNDADDELAKTDAMLRDLAKQCNDCTVDMHTSVDELRKEITKTRSKIAFIAQDTTKKQLFEANMMLQYAIEDLAKLNASVANDTIARNVISSNVQGASSSVVKNERDVKQVLSSLRYTKSYLSSGRNDTTDIVAPVNATIVSVTAADDSLTFTYPYLLVLVIMFIGMLLASTLVVTDKTSKASFRNFTTPTSDSYHILVAFITAFVLLVCEVAIILLASTIFIAQPMLLGTASTLALIIVAIILFTFLGMLIGYLSTTQEAAMIASISIGSVLLFVSNIIVPIEGMAVVARMLMQFNPYLILSELLKKSMLYGVSINQVSRSLLMLLAMSVLLLGATILIQRRIKSAYFRQEKGLLIPYAHIPAPLSLGGATVHDEVELLDALDRMTRSEFDAIITTEENIISIWTRTELRNRRLSKQLRTTSKERMILRLDKHLKKHGKHIKN